MQFPLYRKRFDSKAFYKVTSFKTFEEIQLIGKRFFQLNVHAEKYFEQLQVMDMIELNGEFYSESTEVEFNEIEKQANEYLNAKA